MKKILTTLLALSIIGLSAGTAFAGRDYDDDYYYRHRSSSSYSTYKERSNVNKRKYERWRERCERYNGEVCTYAKWYHHREWSTLEWYDYWESNRRQNIQDDIDRVHSRLYASVQNISDMLRDLLWWF